MTVAQGAGVFLGTDETTGVTIANNATTTSSEIDMLGGTTAEGWKFLYLKLTSTVTAGSVDVKLIYSRVTGQNYADQAPIVESYSPSNATQKITPQQFQLGRYMQSSATNNATGASATNLLVGYEKFLES